MQPKQTTFEFHGHYFLKISKIFKSFKSLPKKFSGFSCLKRFVLHFRIRKKRTLQGSLRPKRAQYSHVQGPLRSFERQTVNSPPVHSLRMSLLKCPNRMFSMLFCFFFWGGVGVWTTMWQSYTGSAMVVQTPKTPKQPKNKKKTRFWNSGDSRAETEDTKTSPQPPPTSSLIWPQSRILTYFPKTRKALSFKIMCFPKQHL